MLILLRIIFGFLFVYLAGLTFEVARGTPDQADPAWAGYVALCVIVGIANGVVWAPYFGEKLSDPLTSTFTQGSVVEYKNHLVRWIHRLGAGRRLRAARLLCFLEGVLHPKRPAAFVLGLKYSPPGSRWERIFAREVYRFDNVQNCIQAYQILRRHRLSPPAHRLPEVNLAIMSLEKQPAADHPPVALPHIPRAGTLARDPNIQLFEADSPSGEFFLHGRGRPDAPPDPDKPCSS